MSLTYDEANKLFTPDLTTQEQLVRDGKCPHNNGWEYNGHSHNSDCYRCRECGKLEFW